MCLAHARHTHAVWQNGGFGAFLEGKVLKQSSGIFSNFGAEKPPLRQAAGTLPAMLDENTIN